MPLEIVVITHSISVAHHRHCYHVLVLFQHVRCVWVSQSLQPNEILAGFEVLYFVVLKFFRYVNCCYLGALDYLQAQVLPEALEHTPEAHLVQAQAALVGTLQKTVVAVVKFEALLNPCVDLFKSVVEKLASLQALKKRVVRLKRQLQLAVVV